MSRDEASEARKGWMDRIVQITHKEGWFVFSNLSPERLDGAACLRDPGRLAGSALIRMPLVCEMCGAHENGSILS